VLLNKLFCLFLINNEGLLFLQGAIFLSKTFGNYTQN
jgi:hypothetical protein